MPFRRPLVLAGLLSALILGYTLRSHFSQPDPSFGQTFRAPKPLPLSGRISSGHATQETCDGIPLPCILDPSKHSLPGLPWSPSDDGPDGVTRVIGNASLLLSHKRFADLDALIERYNTLQYRLDDGRFKLSVIGLFFEQNLGANGDSLDSELQSWVTERPKSAGAAIAIATAWSNAAWRARGNGTANTVSSEGWKLFHERLLRALAVLHESENYAASNPLWYTEYMRVKLGLGAPLSEQLAIYQRGIKAFPEYFQLHMQMMVCLLPQWQGSYEAEAAFIDLAVAHSPPAVRAETYTRLWWRANQLTGLDVDIFRDMGASWPRMKEGFESLMQTYPNSRWNRSIFAAFACDARDVSTYVRLRAELGEKIRSDAFPPNTSIDVCDARTAAKKT